MSINKYSSTDMNRLSERLARIENELKDLKTEKKVHFSAIQDGALRIIDDSGNEVARLGKDGSDYGLWLKDANGNELFKSVSTEVELINALIKDGILNVKDDSNNVRIKLGKISTGVYGIKMYDANGNEVQEITDNNVDNSKIVGIGYDSDGDVIFSSLVVPTGRKVVFQITPSTTDRQGPTGTLNALSTYNDGVLYSDTYNEGFLVLGTVLSTNFESHKARSSPSSGYPQYLNLKITWSAGTYSNIKLYARQAWYDNSADEHWDQQFSAPWIAYEIDD